MSNISQEIIGEKHLTTVSFGEKHLTTVPFGEKHLPTVSFGLAIYEKAVQLYAIAIDFMK